MSTPGATQRPDLRAPLGAFRAALIAVSALLCVGAMRDVSALYVLLALGVGALCAYRYERFARPWPYLGSLLAASFIPFTGGSSSALLPYLLASGLSLGLTAGPRQLVLVSGEVSGVLVIGGVAAAGGAGSEDYWITCAQWVLLSYAVGLVAHWSRSVTTVHRPDEYGEVRRLLEQVRNLTRHLPGTLDAAGTAEVLLSSCRRVAPHEVSAVIVQLGSGEGFVPLAVTGSSRVPWRAPLEGDGPLQVAWSTGEPHVDRRGVDRLGRRKGSSLLALPLLASHGPFGLVILESHEVSAFPQELVDLLADVVSAAAPRLETALLFDEVRLEASVEERDRLARDMHDGIAQELAYLGYQLDDLRARASANDADLEQQIILVREGLSTLMSDLRLSITDLRTTVRAERGLGAALTAYLRAVCAGKDLVLNLSLQETAFRLPAEHEACLLRVAQLVAQQVRHAPGARELTVRLVVDPPSALLHLACDVGLDRPLLEEVGDLVAKMGGEVDATTGNEELLALTVRLKGSNDDHSAADRRPRTHPAGAAARVRAD